MEFRSLNEADDDGTKLEIGGGYEMGRRNDDVANNASVATEPVALSTHLRAFPDRRNMHDSAVSGCRVDVITPPATAAAHMLMDEDIAQSYPMV